MPELITVRDSAGSRRAIPVTPRMGVAGERNVYTISLLAWNPHTEDEAFRAIRLRRPLERSDALRALAGQAWASIQANRNVDVDAWARQIADDVADAED